MDLLPHPTDTEESLAAPPTHECFCPVCHSLAYTTLVATAPDPITLDLFQIVRCLDCGLDYTYPRPKDLDRYYPPRYRKYNHLVMSLLDFLYKMRVNRWAREIHGTGSVLEVGCGAGLMLRAFRNQGWRAVGLERNEELASEARRHNIEVTSKPLSQLDEDGAYDLIILFNVLEHIGEPIPLLRECARLLKPGGRVIISLQNIDCWQAHFAGGLWSHLDPPRHLIHFSPKTLRNALISVGLTVSSIRFISLEHDPYGWLESINNRLLPRQNVMTRYLMGIDRASALLVIAFMLSTLLVLPAFLLSIASWIAGKGSIMELSAEKN